MKAQVTAVATLDVEIEPREIASAIRQYIVDTFGPRDDAGCDWYTDDEGQVFFGSDPKWKAWPKSAELVALVDAANILSIGRALKMPEYETWRKLMASGGLAGYSRFIGTDIDAQIAERSRCERCCGDMDYIAMEQESDGGHSYRAFSRCRSCDAVFEF